MLNVSYQGSKMTNKSKVPNEKIRYQRELQGWSQQKLAELLGTNMDRISRWECGESTPSPFYREKLCTLFHKDAEALGFIESMVQVNQTEFSVSDQPPLIIANELQQQPFTSIQEAHISSIEQRNFVNMVSPHGGDFTRRQALSVLASIPFLSLTQVSHLLHNEEILSICSANIPIAWRLYFDGHLSEAEGVLSSCLPQLSSLALQISPHQKWSASLASKGYQLASMLALQVQQFSTALMHTKQAIQFAEIAGDTNVLVASLIRKALVYFYLKRSEQRLEAYQEAMQYSDKVSPLLRGRVYIGLAEAHSNLVQENEAMHFLDLAYAIFPQHPQEDPNFTYTHFKLPQGYEGLMYLNLRQPDRAWKALMKVDQATPKAIVPDRVELSLRQAKASVALGSLEHSYTYLDSAITSAVALNSTLRFNEAHEVYQHMKQVWPNERKVRDLNDLFIR